MRLAPIIHAIAINAENVLHFSTFAAIYKRYLFISDMDVVCHHEQNLMKAKLGGTDFADSPTDQHLGISTTWV